MLFSCFLCRYQGNLNQLAAHFTSIHELGQLSEYKCMICNKTYLTKCGFIRHSKVHLINNSSGSSDNQSSASQSSSVSSDAVEITPSSQSASSQLHRSNLHHQLPVTTVSN